MRLNYATQGHTPNDGLDTLSGETRPVKYDKKTRVRGDTMPNDLILLAKQLHRGHYVWLAGAWRQVKEVKTYQDLMLRGYKIRLWFYGDDGSPLDVEPDQNIHVKKVLV